ncbi:MAG: hypothetical protein QOC82_2963, partial [Frankiaceae bacterium]|nr:hypothetical protein [Frankiaceae bacterium]
MRDIRLLLAAAAVLTAYLVVEVVVAVLVGSVALLADAGHLVGDVLALLMAAGA